MKQFLRETWQLWYWAHFTPSKLQRRMNEWTSVEERNGHRPDTDEADILLVRANPRFLAQFFLLLLILSSPLILMIALNGQPVGWWLVVAIPLLAYGFSFWSFFPFALYLPLLFTLLYLANAPLLHEELTTVFAPFPPLQRLLQASVIGYLGLIATSLMGYHLWLAKRIGLGRLVLIIGNALSYAGVFFLVSESNPVTFFSTFFVAVVVCLFVKKNNINNMEASEAFTFAVIPAVVVAIVVVNVFVIVFAALFAGAIAVAFAFAKSEIFIVALIVAIAFAFTIGLAFTFVLVRIFDEDFGKSFALIFTLALVSSIAFFLALPFDFTLIFILIFSITFALIFATAFAKALVKILAFTEGEGLIFALAFAFGLAFASSIGTTLIKVIPEAVSLTLRVLNSLPLPLPSLAGLLIGSSFANKVQQRWGIGITVILALLMIKQQGSLGLFVIPPTLIGYYRLLDYCVLSFISLWRTMRLGYKPSNVLFRWLPTLERNNHMQTERLRHWLHTLPPHNHELLWFRLPGHAHILVTTFQVDAEVALETLQQMRTSPYRGLPRTAQYALPQIVSDQLLAPTSVNELINTATPEHPILPFLLPHLYQPEQENLLDERSPQLTTFVSVDAESVTILPRLQRIARDVKAALEGGSAYLRQRGLDGALNKLARLQGQLPGMGLNSSAITRWRAVLEHWQAVIQDQLEQQQAASQGEILNPFQTGNPLRMNRKYLFKGRQQFADDILRQVLNRSRPTLVLHGPRRCGKSSFLYNLPRLLPSDVIPVYLDLQNAASISSEANFCYSLVRAMGRDMRSQGLTTTNVKRSEFRANPYAALEDWLDEAEQVLEERRILFCLDEFEKLGAAIKEGKISLTLFDQLRHLMQHREELSFLFCGVQTLAELGPNWSSYFISIEPVEMLYLEQNEARDLLEDPDPEFNLGYEAGIVEEVLRVTRGQPYLVQLIGEAMVKQANQHGTFIITRPLLEAALERALTAGQPYFTNLWSEYTGEFDKPDEVAAGQRVLHALAHGQPLPPTDEANVDAATRAAIRRMARYHVIEQDEAGAYRFEVPFVARWVKERAVLD